MARRCLTQHQARQHRSLIANAAPSGSRSCGPLIPPERYPLRALLADVGPVRSGSRHRFRSDIPSCVNATGQHLAAVLANLGINQLIQLFVHGDQ